MQRNPTDQLHIVVALSDRTFGGFTDYRERFRQDLIQSLLLDLELLLFIEPFQIPNGFAIRARNSSVLARRASSVNASN